MEVRCDKCQARYRVDDARIGRQGLTMRCGKCQNTFRVMRPAGEAPAGSPSPGAARANSTASAEERASRTMVQASPASTYPNASLPTPPMTARPWPTPQGSGAVTGETKRAEAQAHASGTAPALSAPSEEPRRAAVASKEEASAGKTAEANPAATGSFPQAPNATARTPDRAAPKTRSASVIAAMLLILLAGLSLVVWKQMARQPPPQPSTESR